MATPKHNANGHRRRELTRRVRLEETHCALCGEWVDQTLTQPHPRAPVVDEDIPRARGGSPYDRNNCHLMHRQCNQWKSTKTLQEARDAWNPRPQHVQPSPGW